MNLTDIKTNSAKAWFLASRPKTLTGAIVPVAIALALAWHDLSSGQVGVAGSAALSGVGRTFLWWPALLCMLFACMMQIDANLVNDYYDCARGIDAEDRLGPERACSQGWVTMSAMRKALVLVTLLSALIGLPLIYWGGWQMVVVGVACIVFCYLYTTLLSGKAMGDILVLVFFGWVPVCTTYFLQTGVITLDCLLLATGCGLATDNLLIVNNFRDRETDKKHGKMTLVTLIGEKATLALFLLLGLAALLLALYAIIPADRYMEKLVLFYWFFLLFVWQKMRTIRRGRELNKVLGMTALSILLYGITVCLALLFG